MAKIICTNLGNTISISLNTEYDVINELENRYTIINDKGIQRNYDKRLFRVVEEVIKPEIVNNVEININNLDIDEDSLTFDLLLKLNNKEIDVINFDLIGLVYSKQSHISCGIDELQGLQDLDERLAILISDAIEEEEINKYNLTFKRSDILIGNIITNCFIEVLKRIFEKVKLEAAFLVMSAPVEEDAILPVDVIRFLDENSSIKDEAINPNSANLIRIWVFKL